MKRRFIDLIGASICLAAVIIVLFYSEQVRGTEIVLTIAGILFLFFAIMAMRDREQVQETLGPGMNLPSETHLITEIILMSEEDTELMSWDLYGKTALVIGRDIKENQVDIDLGKSPYASMVDIEHAVLNYSSGNWYVEDLGSSNGLRIKKAGDGKTYKLSSDTPCLLERGDCLYVGLNRLLLR
jgi:hypothetical protein